MFRTMETMFFVLRPAMDSNQTNDDGMKNIQAKKYDVYCIPIKRVRRIAVLNQQREMVKALCTSLKFTSLCV